MIYKNIQMPKKTKQIEKEAKEEKKLESSEVSKKQSSIAGGQWVQNQSLQYSLQGGNLTNQINVGGYNLTNQIKERKNPIALRVQEAGFKILEDELKSLQEWKNDQKEKVDQGGNLTNEIKERKNRIALRVQEAAFLILKDELKSLQEWKNDQKEKVDLKIKEINKDYQQKKASLLATASLNEEEIKTRWNNILRKAQQRRNE